MARRVHQKPNAQKLIGGTQEAVAIARGRAHTLGIVGLAGSATAAADATQNACANATTKLAHPACRHGMPGPTITMP
jgi:hypothetical protein